MAYFAVQPVVYLVAWILLHVKGKRLVCKRQTTRLGELVFYETL